jgi:hypothetical protein
MVARLDGCLVSAGFLADTNDQIIRYPLKKSGLVLDVLDLCVLESRMVLLSYWEG